MSRTIPFSFLLFLLFITGPLLGQDWVPVAPVSIQATGPRDIVPDRFRAFSVDAAALRDRLWQAPEELTQDLRSSPARIVVGLADGTTDTFRIVRYEMMEPPLAAAYPGIRTFRGISVTDPYRRLRADWTANGFRAVIADRDGRTYIDPFQRGDTTHVIAYRKQDMTLRADWSCGVESDGAKGDNPQARVFGDCTFRTYRLAVAATGEYSNFFGATSSAQAGLVTAQIVTAVNRINQVYEVDFAVRLLLIANNSAVYYYNPATDPYTGNNACTQLAENQSNMDAVIGSANYDLGHVFSTGSGGCAGLGVICGAGNKARGATGLNPPTGDPFYIDYVAHEMGHQLGGDHTFNGTAGSCNGNRVAASAYEPGSGSTIMAYAGICGAQNLQNNSDDYFHARSLLQIHNKITSVNCHGTLTFNNSPPVAGNTPNYTIPISTPFVLTGSATDPDGDPMTYCWEEYDLESTSTEPPAANDTDGPMFRSFDPTASPARYFPRLTDLVNNVSPTWEVLPSVTRNMVFRMTVRDYHMIGSCSDSDDATVSTTATAGPFVVTSQNTATTWLEGQNVTITWNVANTTASPVSCSLVDIYLSYDGGLTYPVTLAEDQANDGSASVTVPLGTTTTGRVMVKASGNIFFDINNTNITINPGLPNYTLNLNPSSISECNDGAVQTTVEVGQFMGYTDPVTLSALNLPPGAVATFTPQVVIPGNTTTLVISNLAGLSGAYVVTVQGSSTTGIQQRELSITLLTSPTGIVTLNLPANNAVNVLMNPLLTWSSVAGATAYDYQIALDNQFSQVVQSGSSVTNQFQVTTPLAADVLHYWRVRPANACGSGNWSSAFSFTTTGCFQLYSPNVPVAIPATGTPTVTSELLVPIDLSITDLDIIDLEGIHTYVDNLKFTLIAPQASAQLFWDRPCLSQDNFDINFDDEAPAGTWPCPPTNGMTYQPDNPFSIFDGLTSQGTWILQVQDVANNNGGSLNKWALKVCGMPPCQLVVNNSGPNGPGSLRAAINCAEPGDTIQLAASLAGQVIQIGANALPIGKDLTILAGAADISITGSGPRIFDILAGNQVLLEGMTFLSGTAADGGALVNGGDLELKGVTVQANPGVPGAVLIRNDPGSILTIGTDCQIQE